MTGLSLNANGLAYNTPYDFSAFRRYHFIALQETHISSPDMLNMTSLNWLKTDSHGSSFWSNTIYQQFEKRNGCGLLFSKSCPIQNLQDVTPMDLPRITHNRYLLVKGSLGDLVVYIHVLYAPTGDDSTKIDYFSALPIHFAECSQHIVCGDFNLVLDPNMDKVLTSHRRPQGLDVLESWMAALGIVDSWRLCNPDGRVYSNPTHSNRIDLVLLSGAFHQQHLKSIRYLVDKYHTFFHNDHAPIAFSLAMNSFQPPKKAPWRCPPWVLQLPEVRSHLTFTLKCTLAGLLPKDDPGYNPAKVFDDHLYHDKMYLQTIVTAHHNKDLQDCDTIRLRIANLSTKIAEAPSELLTQQLQDAKQELRDTTQRIKDRNELAIFRQQLQSDEKCSSHFFRPPVPRSKTTSFPVSNAEDWDQKSAACRQYWAKIFHSTSPDFPQNPQAVNFSLHRDILHHTTSRLTAAQISLLEEPLSAFEFATAIEAGPKNKAPGPDGLPYEYFQVNPSLWATLLVQVHEYNFSRRHMTNSQRNASISLLFKGGSKDLHSNYRPLTLLNVAAKFAPAIFAKRTNLVLPDLLGTDQYGFTPGRSIQHALTRFHGLQHWCQSKSLHLAGAVMCDFAKAFDTVSRPILLQTLQHFGFGPNYCAWMETLFADTNVSILFNSSPLAPFVLGSGVRQGDPISPALFVLFIEPLLSYLRAKLDHLGISTPNANHLAIAFADDVTGILGSLEDSKVFLDCVQDFCKATGMHLNMPKTMIMPFCPTYPPSLPSMVDSLHGPKFISRGLRCRWLGIQEGPDLVDEDRYRTLVQTILNRCNLWKFRARTLHGRVVILRTMILPVLWYTAAVCHVPDSIVEEITKLALDFIYGRFHKTGLVKNHLPTAWLYLPRRMGGLGLPNIATSIKVLRLRTVVNLLSLQSSSVNVLPWMDPVIDLMHQVVTPLGHGLDILFLPIPKTTNGSQFIQRLGRFWFSVLRTWQNHLAPLRIPFQDSFSKIHTPLWLDSTLANSLTSTNLFSAIRPSKFYVSAGCLSMADFWRHFQSPPTEQHLAAFLRSHQVTNFTVSARHLVNKLPKPVSWSAHLVPPLPRCALSALLSWRFSIPPVPEPYSPHRLKNKHLLALVNRPQPLDPPWNRLMLPEPPPSTTWSFELKFDQVLLPVFADFKFRLQHNALTFGYKFQWHTERNTFCPFGCSSLENAHHLFWTCPFVQPLWTLFLRPFSSLVHQPITWSQIVFGSYMVPTPDAPQDKHDDIKTLFHITRSVILRMIWLHRNDLVFAHITSPNFSKVRTLSAHYIKTHIHSHFGHSWDLGHFSDLFEVLFSLTVPNPSLGS